MTEREFDIIVFGSTGDAGKAIALSLSKDQSSKKNWAIAGRSSAKLQALRAELSTAGGNNDCGIVIADCGDYDSMLAMTKRCKVLLSAAGPYAEFGEPVVKACIEARTHYADITGEFHWVAKMREKYEAKAIEAGVCLCSFCGYDCVPAEVSFLAVADELKRQGQSLSKIELCFRAKGGGGLPHGTIMTVLGMLGIHNTVGLLRGYFAYVPEGERCAALRSLLLWTLPRWSRQTGNFTLPNFMGMVNAAIVYRLAQHLGYHNLSYSDRLWWRRDWKSLWGLLPIAFIYCLAIPLSIITAIPGVTSLIRRALGSGSHYAGNESCSVEARTVGMSATGAQVTGVFRCPGDPGIHCTALLARECALAMSECSKLAPGFLTPGMALPDLLPRLLNSGIQIEASNVA